MPINFTCPHCGTTTFVADQYSGQTGPCVSCGKPITVPRGDGYSPFSAGDRRAKRGISPGTIVAIVVILLVGVLMLLPSTGTPREVNRRMQCANNLKQIGLAMLNYEQANGHFPPAFIADKNGKPMHSWRVLLLPYMEQKVLYDQYRFDEPWNSPHNKELASRIPAAYRCPTDDPAPSTTSYAMLVGLHAFSDGPNGRRVEEIKDGLSNTIMVVECAGSDINWMEPRDIDVEKMPLAIQSPSNDGPPTNPGISSRHSNSANVVFCDASVRFLPNDVNSRVLHALTTVDGGEMLPSDF